MGDPAFRTESGWGSGTSPGEGWRLETSRLRLREMDFDDLPFVAGMLSSPEVMRFYPRTQTRDEAREWIARQMERYGRDGHGLWLVLERQGERPVGQAGLVVQRVLGRDEAEIGYLIDSRYWRRGFASEAAAAVRDFAFSRLGRDRVISLIRPENLPSQGVARKIGMTPGATVQFQELEHVLFALERPRDPQAPR